MKVSWTWNREWVADQALLSLCSPQEAPDGVAVCWQREAAWPLAHSVSSEVAGSCCWVYQM